MKNDGIQRHRMSAACNIWIEIYVSRDSRNNLFAFVEKVNVANEQ